MFPEWLEKLLMISFCTVFSGVCVIEILCIFMSKSVFHQFLNINFSTVIFGCLQWTCYSRTLHYVFICCCVIELYSFKVASTLF